MEWALMLSLFIFGIISVVEAMYRCLNSIMFLVKFGPETSITKEFTYLMPGDFLRNPTQEELNEVDPQNPRFFNPMQKKYAQTFFWFFNQLLGPHRVGTVFDILNIFILTYLNVPYIASFYAAALIIGIPVEFMAFTVFPQLGMPFFDWSDMIDQQFAPPAPVDPYAF